MHLQEKNVGTFKNLDLFLPLSARQQTAFRTRQALLCHLPLHISSLFDQ